MFVEAIECFHCFFRVRTNRILSIAECRRFFLLLFKMIKSRCVRIRYFRLALGRAEIPDSRWGRSYILTLCLEATAKVVSCGCVVGVNPVLPCEC